MPEIRDLRPRRRVDPAIPGPRGFSILTSGPPKLRYLRRNFGVFDNSMIPTQEDPPMVKHHTSIQTARGRTTVSGNTVRRSASGGREIIKPGSLLLLTLELLL